MSKWLLASFRSTRPLSRTKMCYRFELTRKKMRLLSCRRREVAFQLSERRSQKTAMQADISSDLCSNVICNHNQNSGSLAKEIKEGLSLVAQNQCKDLEKYLFVVEFALVLFLFSPSVAMSILISNSSFQIHPFFPFHIIFILSFFLTQQ